MTRRVLVMNCLKCQKLINKNDQPHYGLHLTCFKKGLKSLLVLEKGNMLKAIGKRGPSSFVFEQVYEDEFDPAFVTKWRGELGISQHDFAEAFDISKVTLQKIEAQQSRDAATWKRIQVLLTFPDVALWQLKQTGGRVHAEVLNRLVMYFKAQK